MIGSAFAANKPKCRLQGPFGQHAHPREWRSRVGTIRGGEEDVATGIRRSVGYATAIAALGASFSGNEPAPIGHDLESQQQLSLTVRVHSVHAALIVVI